MKTTGRRSAAADYEVTLLPASAMMLRLEEA
jgi:hypothetical protein